MKKFLIFFTILFAVYTAIWFAASHVAETKLQDAISKLKADGTINSYSGNIEITGYPFRFALSLDYPNISFTPKNHNANYNFLYDGSIDLILGLFSNSIKVKTDGNFHLKGNINDYNFHLVSSGGGNQYKIQLHDFLLSPSLISNVIKNKKDFNSMFFKILKSFNIDMGSISVINKLSNGLIFSAQNANFYINTSHSVNYEFNYKETASNALFGEESSILWRNLESIPVIHNAVQGLPTNVRTYFAAFELYRLGKINYNADIKYSSNSANITNIKVNSFSIKDDIESIDLSGKISLGPDKKKIDLVSNMRFTEQWYSLMKRYARSFDSSTIDLSFFGNTSKESIVSLIFSPVKKFANNVFGVNSSETKENYVPKLHKMGTIDSQINFSYYTASDKNFSIDLDKFNLKTNQYSMSAVGSLENEDKRDKYRLELDLENYPSLVDIATNYVNRVSTSAGYNFLILGSDFHISQKTSNTIKSLIQKISEDPTQSSVNASIRMKKSSDQKYPSAGKYSSKEFEILWKNFVSKLVFEKVTNIIDNVKDLHKGKVIKAPKDLLGGLLKNIIK